MSFILRDKECLRAQDYATINRGEVHRLDHSITYKTLGKLICVPQSSQL